MASEPITCEIIAPRLALTTHLSKIARTCSSEVGFPMVVKTRVVRSRTVEPTLTLHLPADLASRQHPVWCLACRIACYSPQTRVSVMVTGGTIFRAAAAAVPREPAVTEALPVQEVA